MSDLDEMLDRKFERRMNARASSWYYIYGTESDKKGRPKGFLIGPYSYEKADSLMKNKKFASATMVELNTSDLGKAGQILRARKLHSGAPMSDIFERVKHRGVVQDDI